MGTVGIHLLLFLILIVGPAFYNPQPKADNTILNVIPDVTDAADSGVPDAQTPPPTPAPRIPPTAQQLQPPPPIPQPAPRVVQPAPTPTPQPETPTPSLLDKFREMFKPAKPTVTPDLTPVNKPAKHQDSNIQVNTQMTKRTDQKTTPKHNNNTSNAKAIDDTLKSLKSNLSSATKVEISGNSSASAANYATVVKSIYERAILANLPTEIAQNNENTRVRITVAKDGTVVSADIISKSGDSVWDDAVQRTLNQVTFIAPFPEGATDSERHYTIDFNPQVERALQ